MSGILSGRDAVVLAGGLGTRIREVLGDVPKSLAPVGEGIMLDYPIGQLVAAGAERILLALGYRAEMVLEWLAGRPTGGPEIIPVVESQPLGTAGALRHLRHRLRPAPVVIMNGDTLVDVDFATLLKRHTLAEAPATLLCVNVPDAGRYGEVQLSPEGRILRFCEKSSDAGAGLISAGVYAFGETLLDAIADGAAESLERDIFQELPPGTLAALPTAGRFVDIGTPEGLIDGQKLFRSK